MAELQDSSDNKKSSILVVDDEKFIRFLLIEILDLNGYEIAGEAGNGKEAVQMYKSLKPDVVLMDIMMPEMDGITALKKIIEFDSKAKVIMLTATEERAFIKDSLNAGAGDYIMKPLVEERVLIGIEKLLADD